MSQNNDKDVSAEDRSKIQALCRDFLVGDWTRVLKNDLTIKPIADGNINQLFYCSLPEYSLTIPNKVVVRIVDYDNFKDAYDYTHVLAISLMLSEKGMSPRILGCFQYGTIMQYVQCRYFTPEDDRDPKLVARLAEKLADFHSLSMPTPKDRSREWISGVYDRWFGQRLRASYSSGTVRQQIIDNKYELLGRNNFLDEVSWLRMVIEQLESPIVFSHNDFNRTNVLITETEDKTDFEILFIDFDWSNYGYRGADLGQYFSEWAHNGFDWEYRRFPTDEEMSLFIDAYVKRNIEIFGDKYAKQEINSRERLTKESKVFAMNAFIRHIIYCIWKCEETPDKMFLKNGEPMFKCYLELKKKFLNDYDIK